MTDAKAPETKRLNVEELNDLFVIFASQAGLQRAQERMKDRLAMIPNGSADIAMICNALDKLAENLLITVPEEKRLQLDRNLRNMRHEIHFVPPVKESKDQVVLFSDDLDALVDSAIDHRCLFCTDNCNKCALGKALDHIMLHTRARTESWAFARLDGKE